jgi:hypothetical protein
MRAHVPIQIGRSDQDEPCPECPGCVAYPDTVNEEVSLGRVE